MDADSETPPSIVGPGLMQGFPTCRPQATNVPETVKEFSAELLSLMGEES